jgi:DNA-directed RNA polymerase subunit M/transcription elongation factor TFIIS
MNDLLGYVLESFFDSRQEKLNLLSTPETLKSKDVVEYIRSNMKGSKAKPGAFLREGALYFLNSMVKEGGALDRGKPGTSAPGYAFVGGKREYGRVSGDDPLRKVQRPLVVPDVDYPGVSKEKLVDVIIHEGLAMFRRWSNRNKPRFFAYNSVAPRTKSETEDDTEELLDLYGMHHKRFARLHELVIEHNDASPIAFSPEKGKLPIGVGGFQTGISINRAPQARWLCLKLRIKEGATWTMYSSSVGKLGVKLSRAGLQPMVSTYGRLWDIWIVLPDELTMPDAYDLIGNMDGIKRIGQASKGAPFRSFLMDSVIISNKTFADDTCIFPLSLHIHHGKEKVATNQKGMGNQDFSIDTGLSMIPTSGMLTLFDQGIENHPLQAMFNAPDLLARVYRFARSAEIIPELNTEGPLLEIDSSLSNIGREAWVAMKEHKDESFMGELRVAPEGRDVTLVYDGAKAYITGLPDDRKLTNIPQTEEFAQLCKGPTVVYGKIQGDDAESLVAMLSMMDVKDYDEKKIYQSFYKRTILIWSAEQSVDLRLNALSGQFVRSVKRAAPDDLDEMMNVSPYGLIVRDPYGMGEDGTDELMPANQNTPVLVLGYEKDSVQNNEARVLIVGKVVSAQVDVLGRGKRQPVVKQGTQTRDEYQEVARVGTFSGFTYEDRRDIYSYLSGLDYQSEHEGDILIDPIEAGMILEMEYRGLLKDKPMWRYNRKGSHRDWQEKQKLPGMGEREVTGVKSTYSLDPMNKEPMPQYNNPKIVGYRVEMGREEQRITPFLIASSDVAFGVGVKSNPPIELSKYTNYVQKENSPFLSVLGFKSENTAKEDQSMFEGKMKERFGEEITIIHNGNTLTAVKKGTKIGEVCENCGGPKIFSPPGFTKQERAADEGPSVYFSCSICGRETRQRDRRNPPHSPFLKENPLVSVEAQPDKANLKFAQKILRYDADGKLSDYKLSEETAPYLHTEWPEWFRRNQRDLLVRGLERLDYEGVVKGIANRTGSPYYQSLLGIAKRNSGKGLIKNRKQHQELAMLYTLCHNDVDFILTWPNATSSDLLDKFESELESSSTIIYQKEIPLTKKAASMLCMQMYAGEDFVSKKQCVRKALASGWLEEDDDDEERKIRIYLIHSGSEKTLRGQAAPRKEELRSIFKTSKDDKKSYIHTADNPVQVTEYAQVLLNENSLLLLQNNNIDLILPRNPNREWVMINSVKKYMQQEFGSLFFVCTSMKSGLGAYLHGIRTTNDVDMMIDDRRLGPDAKEKIERMSELFPFLDAKLAYSERNSKSFWNYETFVPGKTWYDKRNEMTHNPKYHAYFLGLKVETPEGFLYQRMARVSKDSRPRATSDLLMLLILIDEGRFRFLDKKIRVPWKRSMVESYNTIPRWLKIAKFWMKARYRRDMSRDEIWGLLGVAIKHNRPKRNRDLDATEEHLLSGIEGRYNDLSETRNNPSQPRIIVTVPHALPAGEDYEEHWCDWSANPAAHQLQTTLEKKYDTQLHISDKQRTEIDYNRILSAETPWQHELDDLLKDAKMLVDVHSFPVDDPMWAGYDFVLFSSDKWPLKAQEDQSALMEHLRECGYKVMMDIADHRNYIQEKGVKLGIPSFLIEFGEHLKLKKPCEDLAKCLDTFFVKSNGVIPKKRGGMFPTAALQVEMPGERDKHESNETQRKKHDALVQKHMRSDYNSAWGWNRPVAESKQAAEQKALKKARKKADKEIGAFTVCPTDCLFCYNEQHGAKTNPPNTHVVISRSDKADKKLKAVFHKPNGRTTTTHFGGKHYSDYTIHKDRKRMERYNNRHRTNENWNKFMSAGALSKWILWNKPSLKGSFDDYLDMFGITGELKVKTSQAGEIKHGKKNPVIGIGLPMLIGKIIKGFDALETELATDHFRILENPPIFPRPERVSGKKGGKYLMDSGKDVTGLHFKKAEIIGSDKSINVEWENQVKKPEPKPAPKSGMRRIRFNMLRPSKFEGYDESWIVASETSKGHIYSLKVKVHTTLTLQTFPNKKSEPRLRPETYGSIIAFNQIGEIKIKSSGKKHPLFAAVYVSKTKRNVNNAVPLLVRKHTRTIPPFEEFTSTSLEERMKNAGYKRMAARTIGRILPGMVKEGLLVQTSYSGQAVYRNSERAYNEYLAEQEEARNNPRTPEGRKVPKRYLKGLNKTEKAIAKYEVDRGYKYDINDPEAYEDWKSDIMAKARGMETAPSRFKLKFIKKYGPLPKGKDLVSRLAKATGIKKQYVQKAYDKGLAAWRGGHRPGTVQHQWASGRAYALVMGAPTSTGKGKPDFQLAVKAGVRDKNGKLLI